MEMSWNSDSLSAYNKAIQYECRDLAYRDHKGNIYIEWFNRHEEGGQAFIAPDHKLLYVIAASIDNPKPHDFKALISNGNDGVIIKPGVWHTNPIPLENNQVNITTRQCELDATVDCHIASEYLNWLKVCI